LSKAILEESGLWVTDKFFASCLLVAFRSYTLQLVLICMAVLTSGFFPFQDYMLQASMRSPIMATFKQQKVEDFYDIGEELGR
jgi:hypothetical protein